MQYPFSCLPPTMDAIEAFLSPARLAHYTKGDRQLSLRTYIWNARLCEEFMIPVQLAEIGIRNQLNQALIGQFGLQWYQNQSFTSQLDTYYKGQLQKAINVESKKQGQNFWNGNLPPIIMQLPTNLTVVNIYDKVDRLRRFRNRIAHHESVFNFDGGPTSQYRNIQDIMSWICPDTLWLLRQVSNPAAIVSQRPRR